MSNVKELREFLESLPDNAKVWIEDRTNILVTDADEYKYYPLDIYPLNSDKRVYPYEGELDV